jgi:Resolvase, N terminal domain/Recombinase
MSPKTKPKLPIAVYSRVSEQGKRSDEELLSHGIQRKRVAAFLEARGLVASEEVFEDNSKSGRKMSRPAFDRIMEGIREGRLGGIGIYKLSRFGRNTAGVLRLVRELEDMGAEFACVMPGIDTSTADGRFALTIFAALDELEAERAVEGAAVVAGEKLGADGGVGPYAGTSLGGSAPLGYVYEVTGTDTNGKPLLGWLVKDKATAPVVRKAFEKFAAGDLATPGKVADFLNAAGLRTKKTKKNPGGNLWNGRSVIGDRNSGSGFLRNPVYIGTRRYGDVEIEDAHESIVDGWVFRKVQRLIEPKAPTAPRSIGEGHVLGEGLCKCAMCGGSLVKGSAGSKPGGKKYSTLRCQVRGPGHTSISYGIAEDWITAVAFAHGVGWTRPQVEGEAEAREEAEDALAEAQADVEELEALMGAKAPAASRQALALAAAEDALAAITAPAEAEDFARYLTPLGGRELFKALPVAEQRRVLHRIIKSVVISRGKQGSKRQDMGARVVVRFHDGSQHPALPSERTPFTVIEEREVETAVAS